MLSELEINFLLGLIGVYKKKGYNYYLCNTINNRDDNYDFVVYFSKEEIDDINGNKFSINNAIEIKVDSNSYSYDNQDVIQIVNSNFSGIVSVPVDSFIYTNASVEKSSSVLINPDITLSNSYNYDLMKMSYVNCFILISLFLWFFIKSILRLRR